MLLLLACYSVLAGAVAFVARTLGRKFDRASFAAFVTIPVVFLSPAFTRDLTLIPLDHVLAYPPWNVAPIAVTHNPSLNDVITQFAPWAKAVRMAWKEGSLPFWNRWTGCGTPLMANGQSAAFSPFTFLMLALPLARAVVLLAAAKLLLALTGSYFWLSELGISRGASRFGAVLFGLSFAITPWVLNPATSDICLWPWTLFVLELLQDARMQRRAFVALVALLAILPLCGHLETVAIGLLFAGAWLGVRALTGDLHGASGVLRRGVYAALIALGLSAFAVLPQALAIEASNRLILARDPAHLNYVPWVPYKPGWLGGFVTSLFPHVYGDMIDSPMIPGFAGSIVEMGFGYFGCVGWTFVFLIARPGSKRSAKTWIFAGVILWGWGAAMGLPLFRNVMEIIPGIRLTPPLRFLLIVSLAGSALAAMEFDRLLKDSTAGNVSPRFPAAVSIGFAALAIFTFLFFKPRYAAAAALGPQRSALEWTLAAVLLTGLAVQLLTKNLIDTRTLALLVTALSLVELTREGRRLYRFYSPAGLYPETPLVRFLHSQPAPFRVVGEEGALLPDTNIFALVESIGMLDPAERRDYVQFLDRTAGYPQYEHFRSIRNPNAPSLDFLNVKYLVARASSESPGPKWVRVYSGQDGAVFENHAALPRLYPPPRVACVRRSDAGRSWPINAMSAFGAPLERFLALGRFGDLALLLENSDFRAGEWQNGKVEISHVVETTNRVRFLASVGPESGKAIVVSSIVDDGGWSAEDSEGRPLPVGLADGPFLAVAVPSGRHEIVLSYVPPGFRVGALASALTVVVILAAQRLRRPKAAPETVPAASR